MSQQAVPAAALWKRMTASVLDLLTVFLGGGYAIGKATGSLTADGGFNLTGMPALLLFALVIVYFFVCRRFLGGTLWDRVFRIGRPQPH